MTDYQALFEHAPGLFMALSPDFTIVAISNNYARATMVKREDVIGRGLFDVFPDNPDDPNATGVGQLRASLARVLVRRQPDTMAIQKYDIRRPDGTFEERHWSPYNVPVLAADGKVRYIIHRVEDVTDYVRLKQEGLRQSRLTEELRSERDQLEKIRQSQRMEAMGQLAGGVAHDFNNILATISITCENLLTDVRQEDRYAAGVEQILKNAERAASLTRQLLSFSRQQVLQPRVLNLNAVVHDMQAMLTRLLGEHVCLKTDLDAALGNTLIDQGQMEQLLLNLVLNARDAMPKGGHITIHTENTELDRTMGAGQMNVEPGPYVMVSVADTGMGMDAETQARIFEPFFTTKPVGKGTGLGLATVYGIVKQNKGTIWVYSELRKGTVFKVYLPLSTESVVQEAVTSVQAMPSASGKTVLLVEDEEALRNAVAETLQKHGYTVHTATNGMNALEKFQQLGDPVDLLITDVVMPEMGGQALANQLQARGANVKVLFLSGYTEEVLADHGMTGTHPQFLEKPFRLKALLDKVRGILG